MKQKKEYYLNDFHSLCHYYSWQSSPLPQVHFLIPQTLITPLAPARVLKTQSQTNTNFLAAILCLLSDEMPLPGRTMPMTSLARLLWCVTTTNGWWWRMDVGLKTSFSFPPWKTKNDTKLREYLHEKMLFDAIIHRWCSRFFSSLALARQHYLFRYVACMSEQFLFHNLIAWSTAAKEGSHWFVGLASLFFCF